MRGPHRKALASARQTRAPPQPEAESDVSTDLPRSDEKSVDGGEQTEVTVPDSDAPMWEEDYFTSSGSDGTEFDLTEVEISDPEHGLPNDPDLLASYGLVAVAELGDGNVITAPAPAPTHQRGSGVPENLDVIIDVRPSEGGPQILNLRRDIEVLGNLSVRGNDDDNVGSGDEADDEEEENEESGEREGKEGGNDEGGRPVGPTSGL